MKNLFIFLLLVFSRSLTAQHDDSVAVRAMLDDNNLFNVNIREIAYFSDENRVKEIVIRDLPTFHKLTDHIGKLTGLKTIFIINSGLREISDSIANCKDLMSIELHTVQLPYFPETLGEVDAGNDDTLKLSKITVIKSTLKTLPESISQLGLTALNLQDNALTHLPNAICDKIDFNSGVHPIMLCGNPDLVFTAEQVAWINSPSVTDYQSYSEHFCGTEIISSHHKSKDTLIKYSLVNRTIQLTVGNNNIKKVSLITINGKIIKEYTNNRGVGDQTQFMCHLPTIQSGIYVFKIWTANGIHYKKITILL